MKILKKGIFILFATILILIFKTECTYAASASISTNSKGTVNTSMTISVSGTAAQWNLKLLVDRK